MHEKNVEKTFLGGIFGGVQTIQTEPKHVWMRYCILIKAAGLGWLAFNINKSNNSLQEFFELCLQVTFCI